MIALDGHEIVLVRREGGRFHALCGTHEAWHDTSALGAARIAGAAQLGLAEEQVEVDLLSSQSVIVRARRECGRARWWSPVAWTLLACAAVAGAVLASAWLGGGAR